MRITGWSNMVDDTGLLGLIYRTGDELYFVGSELGLAPDTEETGRGVLLFMTAPGGDPEAGDSSLKVDYESVAQLAGKLLIYTRIRAEGPKPMVDATYMQVVSERKTIRVGGLKNR